MEDAALSQPWYKRHLDILILFVLGILLFFAANSQLLITDPVESNYVLTAKEMLASGDYVSPRIFGRYWYDKPILFYLELIAAFKLFGLTSFAARFFSGVFGLIGVFQTYWFANKLYGKRVAFLSSLIMMTSVEYFYLAKAVITDMTLFVTLDGALMLFYIAKREQRPLLYYGAYVLAGIAILTKGPVGLVLPGLIILAYLGACRDGRTLRSMKLFSGILVSLLVAALWYVPMIQLHGNAFLEYFIGVHNILRATVSEHPRNNTWWYYLMIFLISGFPWSFTAPYLLKKHGRALWQKLKHRTLWASLEDRQRYLVIWALGIFLFFECMATKYPTYTFPYLPPLAIGLAAYLSPRYDGWLKRIAASMVLLLVVLSYALAIPLCRQASFWDAAQLAKYWDGPNTQVYIYGGRYPVSFTYYSGIPAPDLNTREKIDQQKPDGISWNAKNMMPFAAIEDLPETGNILVVVEKGHQKDFLQTVPGDWQKLGERGQWAVWTRE